MNFSKALTYGGILLLYMSLSCGQGKDHKNPQLKENTMTVSQENALASKDFDTIIQGKPVQLYWLEADQMKAAFTNYGGRLVGLWVPDKHGNMTDVVVGPGSIKDFILSTEPYFGATIGRVGNRIAKGQFELNGEQFQLPTNNNGNTLHGGMKGFQHVVWEARQEKENQIVFNYLSPDMEEGFPGTLKVKVSYTLKGDGMLEMEYSAVTDKPTPVNLTNHAFFNLNGEGSGKITDHLLKINASHFTPVDETLIPTGELRQVNNTPFDFRTVQPIGKRISNDNTQLEYGGGYDHNFVLDSNGEDGFNHAATVIGDKSGIVMDIYTEEPGLQFYSGNFMEGKNKFKSGVRDEFRTAFALETQHFPDAPNQPDFPSIILEPGEQYHTVSRYQFSTRK